jgi:secreted trypsin-like serine protease
LILRTKEEMQFTSMNIVIIFWIVLFLVIARPSHQYTYSCNSNALCGCSSNPASVTRIVGGESAGTSTWGWAVSISISGNSLCGGSILSSTWIITAAHCLSGVPASQVIVYAGSNTRFTGQSRTAYRTFVNPNYVSSTKANDMALIQLSTPLIMSSSVSSICIPSVSAVTLSAGEWPPAGLSVCNIMAFFSSLKSTINFI